MITYNQAFPGHTRGKLWLVEVGEVINPDYTRLKSGPGNQEKNWRENKGRVMKIPTVQKRGARHGNPEEKRHRPSRRSLA